MSLTTRQEAFAQAVASGKSQSEALRIALPHAANWKPETVWSKSSAWMAMDKVRARVEAIRAELAERGLWSREQSVKVLSEIAAAGEKDSDRVRAVAELNKMHGFEAPQKVEHSGSLGGIRLVIEGVEPSEGE